LISGLSRGGVEADEDEDEEEGPERAVRNSAMRGEEGEDPKRAWRSSRCIVTYIKGFGPVDQDDSMLSIECR
jgi:hypothetical protein